MNDPQSASFHFGFQSRTLLTNINGFSALLADPAIALSDAKRSEYAEIIHACGNVLEAETTRFFRTLANLDITKGA